MKCFAKIVFTLVGFFFGGVGLSIADGLVDLQIVDIRGPVETRLQIGEQTMLYVDIQNKGQNSLSNTFWVELFVDGTSIGGETVSANDPELWSGETIQVAHAWTPVGVGDHMVTAVADIGNNVFETDESNNSLEKIFHVDVVDLVVSSLSWVPTSGLEDGQTLMLTPVIKNIGTDAVYIEACQVSFWLNDYMKGNAWLNETELGPGDTVPVTFSMVWHDYDGCWVSVYVDQTMTIAEPNKGNNGRTVCLPTLIDNNPPEAVNHLIVSESGKTSLTFSWNPSADSAGDLAGYKVYFDGATEPELLPATQSSFRKTGLSMASAYSLRVDAYDLLDNTSYGPSTTGYTILENPIGLSAFSRPGIIDLAWQSSSPEDYVKYYAVYLSETDFLSIESDNEDQVVRLYDTTTEASQSTATETKMTLEGLDSQLTYYFAVVSVNKSGCADDEVVTIAASPLPGTIVSEDVAQDTTWSLDDSPYYIDEEVVVGSPEAVASSVTLVIEPGVHIYLAANETIGGLTIGPKGILKARGTLMQPIKFDRYMEDHSEWQGIHFSSNIEDADSVVENCIIQNASKAITYEKGGVQILSNEFLSNFYGIIYRNEEPVPDAIVECNHFNNCFFAIECYQGHVDQVKYNIIEDSYIDIYGPQGSLGEFHAQYNFFPGHADYVGNVYIDPQLSSRPACVPDFNNAHPTAPHNPFPADDAIEVGGTWNGRWQSMLSWECTDPNPGDTLEYTINYGTDPENLIGQTYGAIGETTKSLSYLLPATTYYWRITARDQFGSETAGPVWRFTTASSPIDLVLADVTWTPETDIIGNEEVTLIASLQKRGEGTTGSSFMIDFRMDGKSVATERIFRTQFDDGETFQVVKFWTAAWGQHMLEVVIDDFSEVNEFDETNNNLSTTPIEIVDPVSPIVVSIYPEDAALLQEVNKVIITLDDMHGDVDEAAVLNSISVLRNQHVVEGTFAAADDEFTFSPSISSLPDGNYHIRFTAVDMAGNTAEHTFSFTVDTQAPAAPTIDAIITPTHNPSQTISGSKEAYAAITLNGDTIVGHTEATVWTYTAALTSGENTFVFAVRDRAGNTSDAATVAILFDDIAPDPVTTLTAVGQGNGTSAVLNWTGYDEAAHGDVAAYRIYWQEGTAFSNVTGMSVRQTVSAGTSSYTAAGLTKDATVWFAVTAVDVMGNANSAVTAVSAVMTDVQAPEDVSGLSVRSFIDRLAFSWSDSADSAGDLAGYRIYLDGSGEFTFLSPDRNTYELTGLSAATACSFKITAVDDSTQPNESGGASITGVTWLTNPNGIAPDPFSGYVKLIWNGVQPSIYVKNYRVYISETVFSDVSGMTPAVTATGASAKVAGLTNGTPYWFAVTTLNTSDGQQPQVVAVRATPQEDMDGPKITAIQAGGASFFDGFEMTTAVTLSLAAQDPSGVSRIEFVLDGYPICTDYSAAYTCYLDPTEMADGAHQLTITAYDTLDNSQSLVIGFSVALAVPGAPTISNPTTGTTTNKARVVVSGQADLYTEVLTYINDLSVGMPAAVDGQGYFSNIVTLSEGQNRIQASAMNRAGQGPRCDTVVVTLNTTLPSAPGSVTAQAREGGVIRVAWQKPSDTDVAGYYLYRHPTGFSDVTQAVKVNLSPISMDRFDDVPPMDGTWYYRVATLDTGGNQSELSMQDFAVSDSTAPRAGSIVYSIGGPFDPDTSAMAPATVNLMLTVTEVLQAVPFLSITPAGGTPISVDLIKISDLTYSGFFVIAETTPSGSAWAIFSCRDMAGNRGTEIDSGGMITIDTDGPSVSRLVVLPESPMQNDERNPVTVKATIGLSEAVKSGTVPYVGYLLSGVDRPVTPSDSLTQVETQTGDAQTWQAAFVLPTDAGLAEAESFSLIYQSADDLGNLSSRIDARNLFQVYQGELPPLAVPEGLEAVALADGRVLLAWNAVDEAAGYMVYRQGPDDSKLTTYMRVDGELEYIDPTDEDGYFTYAVTSIRSENSQEAQSGLSETVTVYADSVAPGAPTDFSLQLVATGIKAQWVAPAYTEPITYRFYRTPLSEITDVAGLTPLAVGIENTLVVDPNPSQAEHCYTVTAVDEAGNQSPPAPSVYLNFQLLPISSLEVVQMESDPPVISWTHGGGSIAGYDFYLDSAGHAIRINESLISGLTYTDMGWSDDTRQYTVVAVDAGDVKSLGRSIDLPVIRATLAEGSIVRRSLMNRLTYTVENGSVMAVDGVRLKIELGGKTHYSDAFALAGNSMETVSVVVGGYEELTDPADLTTTVEITPAVNERVDIVRRSRVAVEEGMLVMQILNQDFTRGGSGTVWFSLENTGDEEIEIVTARNSGNADSDQIAFTLLDEDQNVIAAKPFRQAVGENVFTLSDKSSVARIGAGEIFTAQPIQVQVPSTAPDDVRIRLSVSDIYYHRCQDTQVRMDGLAIAHATTLVETAYTGIVDTIDPETSSGDQEITITGRAVSRITDDLMANVPLMLVVTHDGFERSFELYTDTDGNFTHNYLPTSGQAGIFTVRVVHPDLTDKLVQGQFIISRISVSPSTINLSIPRNYDQKITVKVTAGAGTDISNLRLEYLATDQPGGSLATGIHLTSGTPVSTLSGGNSASLSFNLWADNTAAQAETMILRVGSGENPDWGTVVLNAGFSEAKPVLYFTPDHIETGLAVDDTITETVTLKNQGLAALNGVILSLLSEDGSEAPSWAVLNGDAVLGDLKVGDTREAMVTFAPGEAVVEGTYHLILRVASDNYPQTDINLYASVTQSGAGSVMFKVSDIYTGTLDKNLQIIQGLAGARVLLQNEVVSTESYSRTCDALGEALFSDLPAGRYKARITALNHQEHIGRTWIKPGITAAEDVFLEYNLVTVEWSVNEITIQDKYEVVLAATYETDVPAAVVGIEPASITLPAMQEGDVYNGQVTLTNYGLIRADEVDFQLPPDDAYFDFEFSGSLPGSIGAKQQITIPYRVTCLSPLSLETDGTGGGCDTYIRCMTVDYGYCCTNGVWSRSSVRHCWTRAWGDCSGTGGSGGGGVSGGLLIVSAGPGSSSISYAPPSTTVGGLKCYPKSDRKESFCLGCTTKDSFNHFFQITGSAVNLWMREYTRDHTDLAVKVPGGQVEAKRWYYGGAWHFEHLRHNLAFTMRSIGPGIQSITKGDVVYEAVTSESKVFVNEIYRIVSTQTGFRWTDPRGNWKTFDGDGRMISWGDRIGVVGNLIYDDYDLMIGISDRAGNQVLWYEYDGLGNVSAVADSANRRVNYTYSGTLLTGVTDPENHETNYEYDDHDRIVRTIDAEGRSSSVAYDTYGHVASVVDENEEGWAFEYEYDDARKEAWVRATSTWEMIKETWFNRDGEARRVDVNGRTVVSIVKDGRDELVTGENGRVTRKNYDQWDNRTAVIHPDGSRRTTTYDLRYNKPMQETDENGNTTQRSYDDWGNLTRKVEAAGTADERVTEYTYDDGNLLTVTRLADDTTAESRTVMTYDEKDNLTSVTDPAGGVTQFAAHDIMGNVLEKRDARRKTWIYAYDDLGRLKTVTDPLGNLTEHLYDAVGNRIKTVDAQERETLFFYDIHDNLIQTVDHDGNQTMFEYSVADKLIEQTDAEGSIVRYIYDNEGRMVSTVDGHGDEIALEYDDSAGSGCSSCSGATGSLLTRTVYPTFEKTYTYDNRGRKVSESDRLDDATIHSTGFAYDFAGNLTSRTDKMGRITYYGYDGLNRLVSVTDPASGVTLYAYDDRDNVIVLTDAEDQATRFEYDAGNRLIKEIRPRGAETLYTYDAAGNLSAKVDAKDQKTEYLYDDAGRLEEIRYFPSSGDSLQVKTVIFSYDRIGNLTGYDDGTTSAVYTYDNLYRKTGEMVDYGAFSLDYHYTYYKNGLKETYTGPDAIAYGYHYDANNQLTALKIPGAGFITISEYRWNRPVGMILPGGSTREFDYDPLMRVKQITARDPAANPVLNYAYVYDNMDNITARATDHGDYAYAYDDLYRLTDVDNPLQVDETFTYDGVGNRLTSADTSSEWAYNANNELTGYDDVTFDYDLNGNMIQKTVAGAVTDFFYDLEDRLVRVENGSGNVIANYYYDPFGRRLWKNVGGTRTCFHYSDEGLVGEYDAAGNISKTYGYKPGSTWTTDPLFMKVGSEYYFYHNDHLGTPKKMTAVNGAVVWSATYSSFGVAPVEVENVVSNLRLAGQYYDVETGLHYNYYRYYNPEIGRYTRKDPIGFKGGINLFAYVSNAPLRLIDSHGLLDFPYYKKWGGPGRTAGRKGSWDEFSEDFRKEILRQIKEGWDPRSPYKPADSQDECYMYHDICYGEARMQCNIQKKRCFTDCLIDKKNRCDYELTKCLIVIGLSGNPLNEARRIAAIPVFVLQPAVRNAIRENEKNGTNHLILYRF